MRQSEYFAKTRKEAPKDEVSKNAALLVRAGYIHKEMAGVYSLLPLGLRVQNRIVEIIRGEMNSVGGKELHLASLQNPEIWQTTDRWDDKKVDNWFKTKLKNNSEVGLGFTHEEPLTVLMRDYIRSFRDLPVYVYQFQTKFRNEARAKSGILRTREFLMKDLYSFSKDEKEHQSFYEKMKVVYKNIFDKVGIGAKTYLTYASGGSFSKYSHEFQTVSSAGEDNIYVCDDCRVALNEEIVEGEPKCPECGKNRLTKEKSIEVGNIFTLGEKFSSALGLNYMEEGNKSKPVFMGSYGIGPGRLIGTICELFADGKGLVWPESVAPFRAHLVLVGEDKEARNSADKIYEGLSNKGVEIFYDDREVRAGEKFADADLIGIPWRITVSAKTVAAKKFEVTNRLSGETEMVGEGELIKKFQN